MVDAVAADRTHHQLAYPAEPSGPDHKQVGARTGGHQCVSGGRLREYPHRTNLRSQLGCPLQGFIEHDPVLAKGFRGLVLDHCPENVGMDNVELGIPDLRLPYGPGQGSKALFGPVHPYHDAGVLIDLLGWSLR